MKLVSGILLVAVILTSEQAAKDTVTIKMYAVEASNRGTAEKSYDSDLRPVKDSLLELEGYDTFRKIAVKSQKGRFGDEMSLKINDDYTLYLTPLERDKAGRVKVKTRIVEKKGEDETDNPIKALSATSSLVPGDKLLLGGPKLDNGKLVIVLMVAEE